MRWPPAIREARYLVVKEGVGLRRAELARDGEEDGSQWEGGR
jgi:hypothetical protein